MTNENFKLDFLTLMLQELSEQMFVIL